MNALGEGRMLTIKYSVVKLNNYDVTLSSSPIARL